MVMSKNQSLLPLISIVVPVYNVEKYISQCIASILQQSYSNFELILINDGSTDQSGKIADMLASDDARIQVVHSENKGVSAARNLGIELSKGEYLVFVDSDDYLHSEYLAYMLEIAEKTQANFVMSKNCMRFPSNKTQIEAAETIEIYSPEKAASELLFPGRIEIGCWNKMFQRAFIVQNNITFPQTFYMGEGLNFIIQAAEKSNGVGVGNRVVYYYRKDNPNSATTVLNISKYINAIAAIDNISNTTSLHSSEFLNTLKLHRNLTAFSALNAMLYMKSQQKFQNEYQEYLSIIRKNIFNILKEDLSLSLKIRMCLYCINPIITSKVQHFMGGLKRKFV